MKNPKLLNKISSYFFISSFITSKLRMIPFAPVSIIFNLMSLILGFAGYSVWYLATFLYPKNKPRAEKWYGFAEISKQQKIAAIIGIFASIIGVLAIAFPVLLIPSAWLFFAGNVYWAVSEYHLYRNPPSTEADFNFEKQRHYYHYAILMTAIGLISALAITMAFFAPPATAAVVAALSTILGAALGIVAFKCWLDSHFASDPKKEVTETHEEQIAPDHEPKKQNTQELEPPFQPIQDLFEPQTVEPKQPTNLPIPNYPV